MKLAGIRIINNILDKEMRDEENEWSIYDQEEIEAKLMMTDIILDYLLQDTIALFLRKQIHKL